MKHTTTAIVGGLAGTIAAALIAMLFFHSEPASPDMPVAGGYDSTNVTNPWTFQDNITATVGNTSLGTTTIARSYDGFMAGGGITPSSVATGTVLTLYTHAGGPALCNATQGMLYADSTAFSPNLVISIGTSTSAAYLPPGLVASTTLATTTDLVVKPNASPFRMNAGDRITAFLSDGIANASTTNFANWDIEFETHCWLIGG